jgi:hypothetical protein
MTLGSLLWVCLGVWVMANGLVAARLVRRAWRSTAAEPGSLRVLGENTTVHG